MFRSFAHHFKHFLHQLTPIKVVVLCIILIATFLRFWNLEGNLLFQGDQGRDALIVSKIFKEGDLVFIGPVTSVGNMYLGPLYYYFMLPWLFLSYPSPLGPAYAIATLSVLTVYLMYRLGKELVGEIAAVMGAFFFALSQTVVMHSRFSWNPNPEPFVSLVMIWATYRAWKVQKWYWVVVWICFAVLIQLHYMTLLTGAGFGSIWLIQVWQELKKKKKSKVELKKMILANLFGVAVLVASFIPLILFDAKHDWANVKALQNLITVEDSFKSSEQSLQDKFVKTVYGLQGRGLHIIWEVSLGKQYSINQVLLWVFAVALIWLVIKGKSRGTFYGEMVLISFLLMGMVGTSLYEHSIFDHYIAFLFPVTYLLYGVVFGWLWQKHLVGKLAVMLFALWFLQYNIPRYPLVDAGWKLADVKRTAESIAQRVEPGEQYTIVLLSESKDIYGQNYRYFLSTFEGKEPLSPEEADLATTLFIIDEEKKVEKPEDLPIYEIVVFPDKNPVEVFPIEGGPEITVLKR